MKELIDKAAVVAWAKETYLCENASMIRKVCYKQLLNFLDTLEVKEVDLKRAIDKWIDDTAITHEDCSVADVISTAKYFFELGMRARNPITAADRGIADEIIFALNTLGKGKIISYDKEIEWVMNKVKEGEEA